MKKAIILASGSSRRQALLRDVGLSFEIVTAGIDESPLAGETPYALAERLAQSKARAVAARLPADRSALVIAADTVVSLGAKILGKPTDTTDARNTLLALRQQTHHVYSGLSILDTSSQRHESRVNSTAVTLRAYTDSEMDAYIASGDPWDKAGAYAIQHPGFAPVAALDGCISGVMGLSLRDLRDLLLSFGVSVAAAPAPICEGYAEFGCCIHS